MFNCIFPYERIANVLVWLSRSRPIPIKVLSPFDGLETNTFCQAGGFEQEQLNKSVFFQNNQKTFFSLCLAHAVIKFFIAES